MDWTTILTAVLTFIGGGGLGAIIMFPQKRRSADLENEMKASEQWKQLYMQSREENKNQSNLIDKLYDDQSRFRDYNNRLTTTIAIFKVLKCKNIKCTERKPAIEDSAMGNEEETRDETK